MKHLNLKVDESESNEITKEEEEQDDYNETPPVESGNNDCDQVSKKKTSCELEEKSGAVAGSRNRETGIIIKVNRKRGEENGNSDTECNEGDMNKVLDRKRKEFDTNEVLNKKVEEGDKKIGDDIREGSISEIVYNECEQMSVVEFASESYEDVNDLLSEMNEEEEEDGIEEPANGVYDVEDIGEVYLTNHEGLKGESMEKMNEEEDSIIEILSVTSEKEGSYEALTEMNDEENDNI